MRVHVPFSFQKQSPSTQGKTSGTFLLLLAMAATGWANPLHQLAPCMHLQGMSRKATLAPKHPPHRLLSRQGCSACGVWALDWQLRAAVRPTRLYDCQVMPLGRIATRGEGTWRARRFVRTFYAEGPCTGMHIRALISSSPHNAQAEGRADKGRHAILSSVARDVLEGKRSVMLVRPMCSTQAAHRCASTQAGTPSQ